MRTTWSLGCYGRADNEKRFEREREREWYFFSEIKTEKEISGNEPLVRGLKEIKQRHHSLIASGFKLENNNRQE